MGNLSRTKIQGQQHPRMFNGATKNFSQMDLHAAGDEQGEISSPTSMTMGAAQAGVEQGHSWNEQTPKTRGGASGSAAVDLTAMDDSEPDHRSLTVLKVPFLRELLATFHRVSALPDRLSFQEERLYVSEAIDSLERMREILTSTTAGQRWRRNQVEDFYAGRPLQPAELLAQNLSMVLKNPNNRCFANTILRLWAWLPVLDPTGAKRCWGQTTEAMEEMLQTDGTVDLENIEGLEVFWGWHPLHEQADAADFVHSLWSVSQTQWLAGRTWKVTRYGALEEKNSVPIDVRYYADEGPQSLEQLINTWADEDDGQYLLAGQNAIILQIGRVHKEEGTWTKHHLPLDVEPVVIFPSSSDGVRIYKEAYRVMGLILHLGEDQQSGHFVTVQYYHDIMWLMDDDVAPQPISQLTEQQKGEIFQVWLVREGIHNPSPVLSPVTPTEALETKQPASKRQKTNQVQVSMCNVTNYGKEIEKWILTQEKPIFLVETHLGEEKMQEKIQALCVRGRNAYGMAACPTGKGGTHGGILFVTQQHEMTHVLDDYNEEGHGWLAVEWAFQDWQIVLVGVYMKSGDGLQGRVNSKIWARLVAFLRNLQQPYIVLGDFNEEPEEVVKTDLITRAGGEILSTHQETTTLGTEIDWAITSRHIHPVAEISTDWQVPSRPHCMIHVSLEIEFTRIKVPQLVKYPTIPRMERPDWQWAAFVGQDHNIDLMGQKVEDKEKRFARWASHAEAYILQNIEDAKIGRGQHITQEIKELVNTQKTWRWKRGGMAFWGQLTSILTHARLVGGFGKKQRHQIEKYIQVMGKHWRGEGDMQDFQNKLWHLSQQWNEILSIEIEQLATTQEKQTKEEVLQEESEAYREWLQKGYSQGYKQLFKTLKRGEEAFLRPFSEIPYVERMEARLNQWHQIWQIQDHPIELEMEEEIIRKGIEEAGQWDPISIEYTMKVIKKLGQKAAGIDGISNDFLKCLPWEGVKEMVKIMEQAEVNGKLPAQWTTSLIVLIPKSIIIERPIALVSVVHRLWCKLRNGPIRAWQSTLATLMPWEKSVPGSQCLWIALRRLFKCEVNRTSEKYVVSILCDLSNFYDCIDLSKLSRRWEQASFPPVHAMIATQLMKGPKVLEAEGTSSKGFYTKNGILAGDPLAPQIAKVYLQPILQRFHTQHPECQTDVWVDDISFDVCDENPNRAAIKAVDALRTLKAELEEDGLRLSIAKTGILINHKHLKESLKPLLTINDPKIVEVMRDLGVDSAGGRLRRIKTFKKRHQKGQKKKTKMDRLKIPEAKVKIRLMKGSIQASTMWGIEGHGLPPQRRQQARVALARCIGLKTKGSVDIIFDIAKHHQDPADSAMERQVKAFQHLVNEWPEEQKAHLEGAWQATRDRMNKAAHMWQVVYGPMAAIQAYLDEAGWEYEEIEVWTKWSTRAENHFTIRLEDPWPAIQATLQRDFEHRRLQRIAKFRKCQEITKKLDWSIHNKIIREGNKKINNGIQVWHQGNLQTHATRDELGVCPLCGLPASATHLIWQCKWMHERRGDIPEEWQQDISLGNRPELWERGLVQTPHFNWATGTHALEGLGTWGHKEPIPIQTGEKVIMQIQQTAKDSRVKLYITSIVHYGVNNERLGALNGIVPGKQNPVRAWIYGLLMVANFTASEIKLHIQNATAFDAWKGSRKIKGVADLMCWKPEGIDQRVTAIHLGPKLIKQVFKGKGIEREKDSKKVAKERAANWEQPELEKQLAKQDKEIYKIYQEAAERIHLLLTDKTHFFHEKAPTGNEKRQKTRGEKRHFFEQMTQHIREGKHQWQSVKNAIQCSECDKRATI